MNNIFTVVAHFEDWDYWFINIGYFTSKEEAEDIKKKWDTFFIKGKDMFYEPDDWNSKDKFEGIKHLKSITINEFSLNKDLLLENEYFNRKKDLVKLMKSHNRDWSINKIIE